MPSDQPGRRTGRLDLHLVGWWLRATSLYRIISKNGDDEPTHAAKSDTLFWKRHFARADNPDVDSLFVMLHDSSATNSGMASRALLDYFTRSHPERVEDVVRRARSQNFASVIGEHLDEVYTGHETDSLHAFLESRDSGSFFRNVFSRSIEDASDVTSAGYALSALRYFEDEDEETGLLEALYADTFGEALGKTGSTGIDYDLFESDAVREVPAEITVSAGPNPASDQLTLRYGLTDAASVSIEVFDSVGRRVLKTDEPQREPGTYENRLDVSSLSAGVYLYRVVVGGHTRTGTFVIAR